MSRFNVLLAGIICILLLVGSCQKEELIFYLNSDKDVAKDSTQQDTANVAGANKISFFAFIENMNLTKTNVAFPVGKYAAVYSFIYGSTNTTPEAMRNYVSETLGVLSPISSPLYLPNGIYNFYAVSSNFSKNILPVFNNGESTSILQNGVDYLWWKTLNYQIESSSESIPIIFSHVCTQLMVFLSSGAGVTINEVCSASILPSQVSGCVMALNTGVINPAMAYETTSVSMGIQDSVCQYTMLPIRSNEPLTLQFQIKINNETVARNYNLSIPLPSGQLAAGNSYQFKGIVQGNEILFKEVQIAPWTIVNEQNQPLYPSQN